MKKLLLGLSMLFLVGLALAGCESVTISATPTATAMPTARPTSTATTTPTATPLPAVTTTPTATPMPTPVACTLTAQVDVIVFQRPSTAAGHFGTLAAGDGVQAMMRTADGWLGFDPAVAQAANVGVFRMRWIAPDAAVSREGGCVGLPVAPAISPTACYFMAMADTAVYSMPDASSAVVATITTEGYTAVTGQSASGWYQLDLQDGSLAQPGQGWLNPADGNFNGVCDSLPIVTP
jgi:hypothetical protein